VLSDRTARYVAHNNVDPLCLRKREKKQTTKNEDLKTRYTPLSRSVKSSCVLMTPVIRAYHMRGSSNRAFSKNKVRADCSGGWKKGGGEQRGGVGI